MAGLVPRGRTHMLTDVRTLGAQMDDEDDGGSRLPAVQVRQLSVMGNTLRGGLSNWTTDANIGPEKLLGESFYVNVYVYACARAIATDLATRPFRVGADPDNPNDFDPKHPLALRLSPPGKGTLSRPNNTSSARRLWAWSAAQRVVLGAVAWEIDPSDLTFWPLPATKFKPVKADKPSDVKRSGWFKEFEVGSGSHKKVLKPDRVFYSWQPSQDDWTRPESALQAANLDVQVMVMSDVYDNAFLRNDARPAQLVIHQAFTDPDEERKFRRQFLNRHQGPRNAGRTAFAKATPETGGATPKDSIFIQQLGLSQRDSQAIQRYDAKLRSVCVAMGVPLSRLGDASKRTFSNADKETLNYWASTVKNLGTELADDVNIDLMPLFDNSGNVGWFDWQGVPELEPARRFSVPEVQGMVRDRLLTPEEGRVELGLPVEPTVGEFAPEPEPEPAPAPTLVAVPELPATPAPEEAPPVAASALDAATVRTIVTGALAPIHAALRGSEPDLPSVADDIRAAQQRRARIWRAVNTKARKAEKVWERETDKLMRRQRDAVLSRLTGKRGRQMLRRDGDDAPADVDVDAVFDKKFWEAETGDVYEPLYSQVTGAAFADLEAALDVQFDLDAKYAQDFIGKRTNQLSGGLTNTTYEAIKAQLQEGAAAGESITDLATRIESLFNVTWAHRGETVARTEVISAYNGSTQVAAVESEVIAGLEWIATMDDRTREEHADLDGVIIEAGGSFSLEDYELAYPGDPGADYDVPGDLIINCRCTVAPVLADEMPSKERSAADRVLTREAATALAVDLASGKLTLADALAEVLR